MKTKLLCILTLTLPLLSLGANRVIGGVKVPDGTFSQVVTAQVNGSTCSATQVGPRAFITAAHCGRSGSSVSLTTESGSLNGTFFQSPLYPNPDHDLALIVTDTEAKALPLNIGKGVAAHEKLLILGHGCTQSGGSGGLSGLYMGEATLKKDTGFEFITSGAAVCYGDSGGPALAKVDGQYHVLGIHSKGNIKDTNYHTNLGSPASQRFLLDEASKSGISICGINAQCKGSVVVSQPAPPRCTVSAANQFVKLGESVDFTLLVQGIAEEAHVDELGKLEVESGNIQFSIEPKQEGTFVLEVEVHGPGGTADCFTRYAAI